MSTSMISGSPRHRAACWPVRRPDPLAATSTPAMELWSWQREDIENEQLPFGIQTWTIWQWPFWKAASSMGHSQYPCLPEDTCYPGSDGFPMLKPDRLVSITHTPSCGTVSTSSGRSLLYQLPKSKHYRFLFHHANRCNPGIFTSYTILWFLKRIMSFGLGHPSNSTENQQHSISSSNIHPKFVPHLSWNRVKFITHQFWFRPNLCLTNGRSTDAPIHRKRRPLSCSAAFSFFSAEALELCRALAPASACSNLILEEKVSATKIGIPKKKSWKIQPNMENINKNRPLKRCIDI